MKKIVVTISLLISMLFFIPNVKAATATISVSANRSTVIVGNSVTVTVKVSGSVPIAGWQYSLKYDSNILTLTSGDSYVVDTYSSQNKYSISYTYTFKAKKSGSSKIYISGGQVQDWETKNMSLTQGSKTITCMTQAELEATYSKNNNLNSLGVDGYELSPVFSTDVTEYTVALPANTEKINVTAALADSTATMQGTGEVEVFDGPNQIKVEVTAQNGNIKTYIINAVVAELDPIEVEVNGTKYNIVRSNRALKLENELYAESVVEYQGVEIPAFYNDNAKITLVGLKNSDGVVKFFIYDNGTFESYNELSFGNMKICLKNINDIPYGYTKSTINVEDKDYDGFKFKDTSRFALVYGVNEENGNVGFYVFDNYENTLQRYDIDTANALKKTIEKGHYLSIIFGVTSGVLFALLVCTLFRNNKHKAKVSKKIEAKVEQLKNSVEPETTEEVEIKIGKTHDLRQELEVAKEELKKEQKDEKKETEKDIFDEMEEITDLQKDREEAEIESLEYTQKLEEKKLNPLKSKKKKSD